MRREKREVLKSQRIVLGVTTGSKGLATPSLVQEYSPAASSVNMTSNYSFQTSW